MIKRLFYTITAFPLVAFGAVLFGLCYSGLVIIELPYYIVTGKKFKL
jgi:hypothetical protein